jgi:hypothetical protein
MLESLVISSVLQSLPTIYPISIKASSNQRHPQKKQKRRMEQVKKLSLEKSFPSLFAKTAGIFDNMMCCGSYAEQQLYGEKQEREREHEEEECSLRASDKPVAERGDPDLRNIKKAAPVQETHRQYYDLVDRSSPQKKKACHSSRAPYSPVGSSYSTATTVTANTSNTADLDSFSAQSQSSCNRSLRTTETDSNELFMREEFAYDLDQHDKDYTDRFLTDRTISVPSRRLKLNEEMRRWSEGCMEFEQQNADHYVSNEEVIRKVQSESLAELPYLSMTEGYRV